MYKHKQSRHKDKIVKVDKKTIFIIILAISFLKYILRNLSFLKFVNILFK